MKYIVVLGDGMADRPLPELGGRTPLEAANKPHMDEIARRGAVGMAQTVPHGMPPGSDTANLSVMGYAPEIYYSGRSPLEAVSMGVLVNDDDVTFRMNLVTMSDEPDYAAKTMIDYSAGEISTEEAAELVRFLAENLNCGDLQIYPGISYRHCLVLRHAQTGTALTPPHDITGRPVEGHLPSGRYGERLLALMERSCALLRDHPVNLARRARGLKPANSCWLWGEGTRPKLEPFEKLYGVKGGVVCAVDLLKGIGLCAGMRVPDVPGATGAMWTDFAAKGRKALELLRDGCDLVYIHIEAPDECGHHGAAQEKVKAIEAIDRDVLGFLMDALRAEGEPFRIMLTPDHPTPCALRTHVGDPVPFVLYDSEKEEAPHAPRYTESEAAATGLFLEKGPMLMERLVKGRG
ncbi:MAG: cofactor-independent phosphoglycerate mutase [Clostridiales bacterium]|nr:cofactor-independent phosphoglycerate mutase [Clostridiales bacterium]MDY2833637.1 cofactor-independent phosphoglycerate mutase [Candidatus Aphodomonas sp.]